MSNETWAATSTRDKIIAVVVFGFLALCVAFLAVMALTGNSNDSGGSDVTTTRGYCEGQWDESVKAGSTSGMSVNAIRQQHDNFIASCTSNPDPQVVKP